MKTLKKYWGILATLLLGIVGSLSFSAYNNKRKEKKAIKKEIKTIVDEVEVIHKEKEEILKAKDKIKSDIESTDNKIKDTKEKLNNVEITDIDVEEAIANLKQLGNGKPKTK